MMKRKKLLLAVILTMLGLFLSGCGMEEAIQINSNLSSKMDDKIYLTKKEETEIEKELSGMGYSSCKEALKAMGYTYKGKVKYKGAEHNLYQSSRKFSAKDTKETFVVLNKNQAVMDVSELSQMLKDEVNELGAISLAQLGDMIINVQYPFKVYKTNGKLQEDGYTVQYPLKTISKSERIYAASSAVKVNSKKCTVSGVKDKAFYNKNKKIKLDSEGVITSFKVNNVSQPTNTFTAEEEGTYKIKVKLLAGNTKTLKFTLDKTRPVTNIKSKSYKGKITIKFQDKMSGIRKAVLNGKKIKNGKVVSKKGNYVLKITDQAGNSRTVRFSVV